MLSIIQSFVTFVKVTPYEFDTAFQNTGLSEGMGFAPTPKKKRHKAQSTHREVVVPPMEAKKEAFQLSFFSITTPVSGSHFGTLGA